MGQPDPNRSFLVTGRLSYGCSDLSEPYPHGGTGLGTVGAVYFRPPDGFVLLPAEEDNATRAVLYVGGDAVLGASLEAYDHDAIRAVFPNAVLAGPENDLAVVDIPGEAQLPGTVVAPLTNLVFSPINPDHPGIILFRPVAMIEAQARIQHSSIRWWSVPVLFVGLPDDDDRVAQFGPWAGLTLTLPEPEPEP